MNKKEMIGKIVENTGLTKKDAANVLNATLEIIQETLASGDKVQLVGFGTFEIKTRSPRTTKNPRTQEIMQLPASKTIKFKPGTPFKQLVK